MTDVGSAAAIWLVAALLFVGGILLVRALRRRDNVPAPKRLPEKDVNIAPHRLDRIRGIKRDDPSNSEAD